MFVASRIRYSGSSGGLCSSARGGLGGTVPNLDTKLTQRSYTVLVICDRCRVDGWESSEQASDPPTTRGWGLAWWSGGEATVDEAYLYGQREE